MEPSNGTQKNKLENFGTGLGSESLSNPRPYKFVENSTAGPWKSMIKTTPFKHGRIAYHYRTHRSKISELLGKKFGSLAIHLDQLHENCPSTPFEGDPRASKQRFHHDVTALRQSVHPRCAGTLKGLRENAERFKTSHSKVMCWMLESDSSTVAVEVPVWIPANSIGVPLTPQIPNSYLSGHIDALAVEGQKLWIWDYKPHADQEVWAVGQLTLYAVMLSKQTGIPMELIMCGYFDSQECYIFQPRLDSLQAAESQPAPERSNQAPKSRDEIPRNKLQAVPVPNLKEMNIRKPHVSMSDTETWTWYLLTKKSKSVETIADERQISEDTVLTHLASLIRLKVVRWDSILKQGVRDEILEAAKLAGPNAAQTWKSIYEKLDGRFSYGLIRCALASKG